MEGQIDVIKEQIRTEELNAEHIKNRTAAIDEELAAKEKEQGSIRQEREALGTRIREVLERLSDAENTVNTSGSRVDSLEQSIEELKSAKIEH